MIACRSEAHRFCFKVQQQLQQQATVYIMHFAIFSSSTA